MIRILRYVLILCLLVRMAHGGELVMDRLGVAVAEDFDAFRGCFSNLPPGWAVSKDGAHPMQVDDPDFRGCSTGGVTTGGCYAWQIAPGNYALGCQPTEDKFTPGGFDVVASNATGVALRNLSVSYDVVFLNNADRQSRLDLAVSADGTNFGTIAEISFTTPGSRDGSPSWRTCARSTRVRLARLVAPGELIWIRWISTDAGGSGSRDEYGIDRVLVTPRGPDGMVAVVH